MATSSIFRVSALSADQELALVEIVSEHFGVNLSGAMFIDRLHLLCEDIAGFETGELAGEMVQRIWIAYSRQGQ
ncbi:hypothetical protein [Cupriavidus pauculus]|uniref:hypothetical protein n=1 Tax=Cupriavidus pauculus TaxID=82633 RepID=UPI001247C65C|nr:hypothetical protein [Cupriavidus pauculus]KAB0594617.1 hypothetical protein F7R19_29270 [Cupriavidus pauculus]MCM3609111.1 hypothetical protein [Cupriavidus pauculus]UAL00504.1 hypothetical protein K8O84_03840 [Cupriavidus pauculus]